MSTFSKQQPFHPSNKKISVVFDQVEHGDYLLKASTERVELSKDVVFGKVERLLLVWKKRFGFQMVVGLLVDVIQHDAVNQLVSHFTPIL